MNKVMKMNEAPKKIYLYPSDSADEEYEQEWGDLPWGEDYIEYTRTDALIEKAEKYLKNQFIKDVSVLAGDVVSINFSAAINNFINYLKGK